MQTYESPRLTTVGSLTDMTLGQGLSGNDDRFLFFTYGIDPSLS